MPTKEILTTPIDGILLITPMVFSDDRGYFFEAYRENEYIDKLGPINFVQDNVSRSTQGTVRGLHYQVGEFAQGKLCKVIFGEVLDVVVDIRFGSPTYGKYVSAILSDTNHQQIWIPPGFAHGFSVLSAEAVFPYKCTAYYNKESERAILYNDPDLNIDWKVTNPLVSAKDAAASPFKNILKDFIYLK